MENLQIDGQSDAKYLAPMAYSMRDVLSNRLGISVPKSNAED